MEIHVMYTITIETFEYTGLMVVYVNGKKYGVYKSWEEVTVALDMLHDRLEDPECNSTSAE